MRVKLFGPDHPALNAVTFNLACLAALQGRQDDALRLLRRTLELGYRRETILTDPDLDGLRGDPEFEALVGEVRRRLAKD